MLREHEGWGTRDLGERAGVSAGAISFWERGRDMNLWHASRLALALDVPLVHFIDWSPYLEAAA